MYERLKEKNIQPISDDIYTQMGLASEWYDDIDNLLTNEIKATKIINFSSHSRCWQYEYHIKKWYVCSIIVEKDAFTIVTRLTKDMVDNLEILPNSYLSECLTNSPFFKDNQGWLEYRVFTKEHLKVAKKIITVRASS